MIAFSTDKRVAIFAVLACLAGAALSLESSAAPEGAVPQDSSASRDRIPDSTRIRSGTSGAAGKQESRRLREGTIVIDQSGFFREDGDGATFVAETGIEFGALPNLNLERVVRLLKGAEEPTSIRWSVTGKVTEFSGRNYLLISRAVYKSAAPPPLPDRVAQ